MADSPISQTFVITYHVPRAPIATSYLLYFKPAVAPSSWGQETNTHFVPRFTAPILSRWSGLYLNHRGVETGTLPTQPLTNVHFVGKFAPPQHVLLPALRSNISADVSGPIPTQPETQPHFIGRFTQPVFARWLGEATPTGNALATSETQPHFIGRFQAPVFARWTGAATPSGDSLETPETNVHTIGRFTPPQHVVLGQLRQNISADVSGPVPVPPTNTHFIAAMVSPQHVLLPLLRSNVAADYTQMATQPDTAPHFIGRYTEPHFTRWIGRTGTQPDHVPQPETNTNFIATFAPASHTVLRALRENIAADYTQMATQPDTAPHFIGRFTADRFQNTFLHLLMHRAQNASVIPQIETNVSVIGKFTAPAHTVLPGLRQNIAADLGQFLLQPETNAHFIARPWPVVYAVSVALRQTPAVQAIPQSETQPHFLGRFTAPVHARWSGSIAPPAGDARGTVETGVSFIGKFTSDRYSILHALRENVAADTSHLPAQPDVQPHFVGRFTQPTFSRWVGSVEPPADFLPTVETNTHFVPRFAPVLHAVLPLLRSNIAADGSTPLPQPSTEPHFVGRFNQPVFSRWAGAIANPGNDLSTVETNVHFIARHQSPAHTVNPALRSNVAADPTLEAQPHFVGKFAAPQHTVLRGLFGPWNIDAPGIVANPHHVGRFTTPTHSVLPLLRQTVGPPSGPMPRQPETNTHFIPRYTDPVFARFAYNGRDTSERFGLVPSYCQAWDEAYYMVVANDIGVIPQSPPAT
jgi:hypothetical protein